MSGKYGIWRAQKLPYMVIVYVCNMHTNVANEYNCDRVFNEHPVENDTVVLVHGVALDIVVWSQPRKYKSHRSPGPSHGARADAPTLCMDCYFGFDYIAVV
jgi:hypothetical protein